MAKLGNILVGAAIGVGAVAAAPFTGGGSVLAAGASLTAALTGAGAVTVATGAAGAGVGAAYSEYEKHLKNKEIKTEKEKSFHHGMKEGSAEVFEKITKELKTIEQQNDYIVGTAAFCFYIAGVDGEISEEEEEELVVALNYIKNNTDLPDSIKNKLGEVKQANLDFDGVKTYLDRISVENLLSFETLMIDIVYADDILHDKEKEAMQQWGAYYERRKRA